MTVTALPGAASGADAPVFVRQLEMGVIGALMERPDIADDFFQKLPIDQFGPGTRQIAHAVAALLAEGVGPSPTQVVEYMRTEGQLGIAGGGAFVFDCYTAGSHLLDPKREIDTLSALYLMRDAWSVGSRLSRAAKEMTPGEWVAYAREQIDHVARTDSGSASPVITHLSDYLTGDNVEIEWSIPGLIPKGTATMITAEEGVGKSTVLRQFGLAAMGGFDPFLPYTEKYEPQRVLLVDCEVSKNQLTRSLRSLWSYGRQFAEEADTMFMAVESHQAGLDLSQPHDQAWLHKLVRYHRADLVVIGPVYRFSSTDVNSEEGCRQWQRCFEPMLADGIAVITEHHAPQSAPGALRDLRPIGSSAMRRWFAQGISLRSKNCGEHDRKFCNTCQRKAVIEMWRGARDEEVRWPRHLMGERGGVWWSRDEQTETIEANR